MTTTKEKGGTLEVMEMCANRLVWMVCLHPQTLQLTATTCQQFSECQFFIKSVLTRKAARHNDTGLQFQLFRSLKQENFKFKANLE